MPRHDDDDDDRPRRRPRRDEDDDDRPRARRREDDEDDDRPRVRRRRDEYDERPRRRRARPEPQGSALGVIALVSVGGVVVLIALIWWAASSYVARQNAKVAAQWEAEEAAMRADRQAEVAQAAREVRAAPAEAVIRITAVELARAYDQNEDAADARYAGKVLELNGKVVRVALDDDEDEYTVELQGTEGGTVDCQFAKGGAIRVELGELRPGTLVKIRGKCTGGPVLEGCALVK